MTPRAAMVFAAGRGTRMGSLTDHIPKPLIPLSGRPLIDHAIDVVREANVARVVVNTHYLADTIRQHLDGSNVLISHEDQRLLDTGGGLKAALPLLDADPVLTANSDAVFEGPNPIEGMAEAWQADIMGALVLVIPLDRAIGRTGGGDFQLVADGRIARGGDLVYTGFQIIRTRPVSECPETVFSLNLIWDQLIAEGRLFGCVYPGSWVDIGHPDGLALAERHLAERRNVR